MTTGQRLSSLSSVSNVSAMTHFMNLIAGGGGVTFIPVTTITAEVSQASLDASISYSVYSANIIQVSLDASVSQASIEANVSQITLEGNL